jgi:hypothetical protein
MAILIFIFSFLLILGLQSTQVLQQKAGRDLEVLSYLSFIKTERQLRNQWIQKQYRKVVSQKKKIAMPSSSSPKIRQREELSKRHTKIPYQYGKLFLKPVFKDLNASNSLSEIVERLVLELYGHTSFFKEASQNVSQELMRFWLQKNQKNPIESFKDLFPENEPLKSIFYKMLRGTSDYNVEKKEGYPPFRDFFSFQGDDETLIYFNHAHFSVLKAFFGREDLLLAILAKEAELVKQKTPFLSSHLNELLIKQCDFSQKRISEMSPYLYFGFKSRQFKMLSCQDRKLKLTLKKIVDPKE